jgi:hypothetical protein
MKEKSEDTQEKGAGYIFRSYMYPAPLLVRQQVPDQQFQGIQK